MPIFDPAVFDTGVFDTAGELSGFPGQKPVRIPNPMVGPMALRMAWRQRAGWDSRLWTPGSSEVFVGVGDDPITAGQKPVLVANRNTGPLALRRQGLWRHQWQKPWGGAGTQATADRMRVTQEVQEVLVQSGSIPVRVTQEVMEVIAQSDVTPVRVTQAVVEVLRRAGPDGGPQIIIVGM